jgi:hypothetical protein
LAPVVEKLPQPLQELLFYGLAPAAWLINNLHQ